MQTRNFSTITIAVLIGIFLLSFSGYAEAAIRIGQNILQTGRDTTGSVQLGDAIYAPYIVANCTTQYQCDGDCL